MVLVHGVASCLCTFFFSPSCVARSPRLDFHRSVYPRVLTGLALAQLTLAGYVYVRAGITQATLILPLPICIYWYGYRSYKR